MKHIICFHLFNDYSGSPKILKMVIDGLSKQETKIDLITSKGGILDEINHVNVKHHYYRYKFSSNPIITMARYITIQIYTFLFAFKYLFLKDTIFYINTLLPLGPAIAGRIMRKHVIYHYHENAAIKGAFYNFLSWCMQKLACDIICVSEYQSSFLKRKSNVIIVPNALPEEFTRKLKINISDAFDQKAIMMLSSLKAYKGTLEFINLAEKLPIYNFILIINDTQNNINLYLNKIKKKTPNNLKIYPRQSEVSSFYNSASIVLNLSNKNLVIETFGLTSLEAMSAGLPVIVPTVGGIAELVEDDINGYKIDVENLDKIANKIKEILSNKKLYSTLANNALTVSKKYSEQEMIKAIMNIINK